MGEDCNKKEECPLCSVSRETLDRLKQGAKEEEKPVKKKNGFWRKIFILILILVLVGFVAFKFLVKSLPEEQTTGESSRSVKVGSFAPDFVSEDVDGNRFSLSDFRNKKPVLLVFWATWCGQCAKEMPNLKIFTQRYQDVIQVIAVDSGEPRQTIKEYIREKEINFLILLDEDRKIWNQYLVRGTPFHFLIDKEGKIITLWPGLASLKDLETMLTMLK